jgi:hypothetical protein
VEDWLALGFGRKSKILRVDLTEYLRGATSWLYLFVCLIEMCNGVLGGDLKFPRLFFAESKRVGGIGRWPQAEIVTPAESVIIDKVSFSLHLQPPNFSSSHHSFPSDFSSPCGFYHW